MGAGGKIGNNHAFLILTDCVSDAMIQLYIQVRAATASFGETYILYHSKAGKPESKLAGYNTYIFTDSVMSGLGYTPLRNTLVPGSNHFPILKFHLDHPNFEYYWCIEDDVVFNGDWSTFFNEVIKNVEYDFISSFIKYYKDKINPDWFWWNSFSKPGREIDLNDLLMSFNPIYSISNRAAKFLDQSLKDGWIGHHEVLMVTLLYLNNFEIKDFGGNGSFVPFGFNDKFYTNETYLWRPAFQTPGRLLNKIYHPVKNQYKVTTDFKYKISFCIIGSGMLDDLKRTLIKNIEDNSAYENYEFVVFDYSRSDAETWLKDCMREHIDNGKLVFYNTCQKKRYSHNYAKNVAFKLASGDIVCYIKPEEFIGKDFTALINDQFKLNSNIVIAPEVSVQPETGNLLQCEDSLCARKEDFLRVRGFDEHIKGSCLGVLDFITRIERIRKTKLTFNNDTFGVNPSSEYSTVENSYLTLDRILVHQLDSSMSKVIFIYSTGLFEIATINNNVTKNYFDPRYSYLKRRYKSRYALKRTGWAGGRWYLSDNNESIILKPEKGGKFELIVQDHFYKQVLDDKYVKFYILNNPDQRQDLINFHYQFNYSKLNKRICAQKNIEVNRVGFGKAIVYRNFNLDFPIVIT